MQRQSGQLVAYLVVQVARHPEALLGATDLGERRLRRGQLQPRLMLPPGRLHHHRREELHADVRAAPDGGLDEVGRARAPHGEHQRKRLPHRDQRRHAHGGRVGHARNRDDREDPVGAIARREEQQHAVQGDEQYRLGSIHPDRDGHHVDEEDDEEAPGHGKPGRGGGPAAEDRGGHGEDGREPGEHPTGRPQESEGGVGQAARLRATTAHSSRVNGGGRARECRKSRPPSAPRDGPAAGESRPPSAAPPS